MGFSPQRQLCLLCWCITERDEQDAINEDNILDERTRGATKQSGTYAEPGDEEGLEAAIDDNDGTSAGRQ